MGQTDKEYLSEFLRKFRKTHELSLAQLADRTGISRSMLCQIESGKTTPTLNVIRKLSQNLGTPIGVMLDPYGQDQCFSVDRADSRSSLVNPNGGLVLRPLNTKTFNRSLEVFEFEILKKGVYELEIYPRTVIEHRWLHSGELVYQGVEDSVALKAGDFVEGCASVKRSLVQKTAKLAKGILVRHYT